MTPPPVLVEVCVETARGASAAARGGAGRLEVCSGLALGGLTPSPGLIASIREATDLPLHVLIRPRPGDFLYDSGEIAAMQADIAMAAALGARGVVVGALDPEGEVHAPAMRTLLEAARPLAVTFHRAFDLARDAGRALDALLELGVERLLTSGQAATAEAGLPLLRTLVARAGDRLTVMAGGGVSPANAAAIVREAGVREIHLSARAPRPGAMRFTRDVPLSAVDPARERMETDERVVRAVVEAVNGGG